MQNIVWRKLPCLSSQLQLEITLTGGQNFRWKRYNPEKDPPEWIGVMANCLWLLKQNETELLYRILGELCYPQFEDNVEVAEPNIKKTKLETTSIESLVRLKIPMPTRRKLNDVLLYEDEYYESLLKTYFRLDIDLEQLYKKWSEAHKHFKFHAEQFYAVRMLDQDPVENIFSFICSQNNHISRISIMVEKLCSLYGTKICEYDGITYHAFPDVKILSDPKIESELRKASFGYRAKFIQKSAEQIIQKGGLKWFNNLQKLDYRSAHKELVSLMGIGLKVADCICLMSLNHLQAVPVDTHVLQIAEQHYMPNLGKIKNLTPQIYARISDNFINVYGKFAGWAQTILFVADLSKFKDKRVIIDK